MNNTVDKKIIRIEGESLGFNILKVVIATLAVIAFAQSYFIGKPFVNISLLFSMILAGDIGEAYIRYKYDKSKGNLVLLLITAIAAIACIALNLFSDLAW